MLLICLTSTGTLFLTPLPLDQPTFWWLLHKDVHRETIVTFKETLDRLHLWADDSCWFSGISSHTLLSKQTKDPGRGCRIFFFFFYLLSKLYACTQTIKYSSLSAVCNSKSNIPQVCVVSSFWCVCVREVFNCAECWAAVIATVQFETSRAFVLGWQLSKIRLVTVVQHFLWGWSSPCESYTESWNWQNREEQLVSDGVDVHVSEQGWWLSAWCRALWLPGVTWQSKQRQRIELPFNGQIRCLYSEEKYLLIGESVKSSWTP